MATIGQIVSAKASEKDSFWTPSATRRWPKQAMAAVTRGERVGSKQSKARHTTGKAGKRNQLQTQRVALGMPG